MTVWLAINRNLLRFLTMKHWAPHSPTLSLALTSFCQSLRQVGHGFRREIMCQQGKDDFKMGLLYITYITWLLDTFMTVIEIGILLVINFPPCGHLCIFKRQEPSSYLDVGRFQHTLFPHFSTANLCKSLYKVDCMAILLHVLLCNLLPKSWCIHKWYQTGRTYRGSSLLLLFPGIQFPFLWQQWNISWNFTHRMLHLRCSFLSACCRMRLSLNND